MEIRRLPIFLKCIFIKKTFFPDTPYTGPFDTRGASNILLIVVMIIITIAFIVFTVIFGKKFIVMFCKESNLPRNHSPSPQNELTRNRAARVNLPAEPDEVLPALPSSVDDIDNNLPSAPPSYEDVIKENPGLLIRGMPTAPPSYTESCSATTTQVWRSVSNFGYFLANHH